MVVSQGTTARYGEGVECAVSQCVTANTSLLRARFLELVLCSTVYYICIDSDNLLTSEAEP